MSIKTHRWQPTRLPRPWDSPCKNTGVGCHALLQGIFLPGIAYLRRAAPPLEERAEWRRRGYAPLLYLQSHCDVPADRDRYVRELMRYIPVGEGLAEREGEGGAWCTLLTAVLYLSQVDSYGKCLQNRELPAPRLRDTATATMLAGGFGSLHTPGP